MRVHVEDLRRRTFCIAGYVDRRMAVSNRGIGYEVSAGDEVLRGGVMGAMSIRTVGVGTPDT